MDRNKMINVLLSKQFNEFVNQAVTGLQITLKGVITITNAFAELEQPVIKPAKSTTLQLEDSDD